MLKTAVSCYKKQSKFFKKAIQSSNQTIESSYEIASCIAKHGKPFSDGDFLKDAFISCSNVLFNDLPNKNTIMSRIKDVPTSSRTVERRFIEMARDVKEKQTEALKVVNVFSVALDESVDINDVARLAIIARYCSNNRIHEELICLEPMYDFTKAKNIFDTFIKKFEKREIDITKIFAVTTDGAAAMVGKNRGFVALLEEKIGRPVMKLHCIIHQENLCAKMSNSVLSGVMSTVTKIVNFLVARSSTTHREFRIFLKEKKSEYNDVPLFCEIRWLSRGKILSRFVECIVEIRSFLMKKGKVYPELEDKNWLAKLMFLTDITTHLNELNLRLQGPGKTVINLFEEWKSFVGKLDVYEGDIRTKTFRYFSHLKKFSLNNQFNASEINVYMRVLRTQFRNRFQNFQLYGSMFSFLIKPDCGEDFDLSMFDWIDVKDFQMQMIDFKASLLWVSKFVDLRKLLETVEEKNDTVILECWESLPNKFSCLKNVAMALLSVFGSTYMCEQIFSHMRFILSPYRNRLTPEHSEACVQLKVSKYIPDIKKLSKCKQEQRSH
jgi:hypothetical protein